jgi:hypothetical protein
MSEFGCKECCKQRLSKAVKDLVDARGMTDREHNLVGIYFNMAKYALDEGKYNAAMFYSGLLQSIYDQSDKRNVYDVQARYPDNPRMQQLLGELGSAAGDCCKVMEKKYRPWDLSGFVVLSRLLEEEKK